jgi:hypothetical protein
VGKVSPIGGANLYLFGNFHNMFFYVHRKRESTRKWEGRGGGSDVRIFGTEFNRHNMEHGQPHA